MIERRKGENLIRFATLSTFPRGEGLCVWKEGFPFGEAVAEGD